MLSRCALMSACAFPILCPSLPAVAACTKTAEFILLGSLDPTAAPAGSYATGISADGQFIVGGSFFNDGKATQTRAFRWSAQAGMMNLGIPSDSLPASVGGGVSDDGSVIAGAIGFVLGDSMEIRNGAFWKVGQSIESTAWNAAMIASDVSGDGSIIVGTTRFIGPWPVPKEAFYYTEKSGLVELGTFDGGSYSAAEAISGDGSTIVGYGDTAAHIAAGYWTADTGWGQVPGLPDEPSQAGGVSADGTYIVGLVGNQLFRWSKSTGAELLGNLPGASWAQGLDISADGSFIVGYNYFDEGQVAFIWSADKGMRTLQGALESEFGIDLGSLILVSANAVSDDGRSIAGYGINAEQQLEAFLVRFGFLQDITGDGTVDVTDLLAVINAWGDCPVGGGCPADIDANGAVNVSDLLEVINAWGECD